MPFEIRFAVLAEEAKLNSWRASERPPGMKQMLLHRGLIEQRQLELAAREGVAIRNGDRDASGATGAARLAA